MKFFIYILVGVAKHRALYYVVHVKHVTEEDCGLHKFCTLCYFECYQLLASVNSLYNKPFFLLCIINNFKNLSANAKVSTY